MKCLTLFHHKSTKLALTVVGGNVGGRRAPRLQRAAGSKATCGSLVVCMCAHDVRMSVLHLDVGSGMFLAGGVGKSSRGKYVGLHGSRGAHLLVQAALQAQT